MTGIRNFLKFTVSKALTRSKGLDKPIFVVTSLVLAMLFLAVYFTAASGWIDSILADFAESMGSVGIEEGGDE